MRKLVCTRKQNVKKDKIMRTKTMLLSALLGTLGSLSVHAQNVYSLNAVGYVNVTVVPGFNIIADPLIGAPDPITGTLNTIGTLLPNNANQLAQATVWSYDPALPGGYTNDTASTKGNSNTNGWKSGGQITMAPGQAVWFDNPFPTNLTFTFVGTVPSGSLTNTLGTGFNLVSSILPMQGDLVTNSLSMFTNPTAQDVVWVYSPSITNYITYNYSGKSKTWGPSDPMIPSVGAGFWYQTTASSISWVESYSVSQ
jgi:hypothetical protein